MNQGNQGDESAPITTGGVFRIFAIVALCWGFVRSSLSPAKDNPHAWYDRVIRGVGGILISLVIAGGVVGLIMEIIVRNRR